VFQKTCQVSVAVTWPKLKPIFKNLSLLERVWSLLQNPYKTVHNTFSMLLHYLGKLESKFGENYTVLLKTCFILLALTRWNLNRFSQFFHCWKKKKIRNKTTTNWKNCFRRSLERFMRAVQFASVSSCARTSPLQAFQLQMLFYDADNRWLRNACPLWYFMDCAVSAGLVLLI